jgi:hypothetical protein
VLPDSDSFCWLLDNRTGALAADMAIYSPSPTNTAWLGNERIRPSRSLSAGFLGAIIRYHATATGAQGWGNRAPLPHNKARVAAGSLTAARSLSIRPLRYHRALL